MKTWFGVLVMLAGCGSTDGASSSEGGQTGSDTSTSTSSSETGTEGSDDGMSTKPGSDQLGEQMCDPWADMDCPEGQKCSHYATMGEFLDAAKCVPVMGDQQPGEPCIIQGVPPGLTGLDDCAAGSMCWDVDPDTDTGYCVALCKSGPDYEPVCADGTTCELFAAYSICRFECDPLKAAADCPGPNQSCLELGSGTGFVCRGRTSEDAHPQGTACEWFHCDAGLFCAETAKVPGCLDPNADGCCTAFCDVDQPNTCPDQGMGVECVPWFEPGMAPPGYEHVGQCVLP
jgi:hypothetical protein